MATSGWFITAMAAAGLAGGTMNYFTPAALIRALAILRTGGRYLDRLISHEATFRLIGGLRGFVFARLEPLAPAGSAICGRATSPNGCAAISTGWNWCFCA